MREGGNEVLSGFGWVNKPMHTRYPCCTRYERPCAVGINSSWGRYRERASR